MTLFMYWIQTAVASPGMRISSIANRLASPRPWCHCQMMTRSSMPSALDGALDCSTRGVGTKAVKISAGWKQRSPSLCASRGSKIQSGNLHRCFGKISFHSFPKIENLQNKRGHQLRRWPHLFSFLWAHPPCDRLDGPRP